MVRIAVYIGKIVCIIAVFISICNAAIAQNNTVIQQTEHDRFATPDSTVQAILHSADSASQVDFAELEVKPFKPNPTKAVIYSAILPGLGQIYNRSYWKLPIVYGGLMGCIYAVTWNNKNYKDYSSAYFDLMYDINNNRENPEAWSNSWKDIAKKNGYDAESFINDSRWQENIKRRKDYYRRYRDLSIIITAGVYALCMIDAYVDAQLFDFDISPDLSMRVEPVVTPKTRISDRSYGLNCSIKF